MGNLIKGTTDVDVLAGRDGDTLRGGQGSDLYQVRGGTVTLALEAGGGQDVVDTAPGSAYRIQLGAGLQASDLELVWTRQTGQDTGRFTLRLTQGRGELLLPVVTGGARPDGVPGLEGIYLADGQRLSDAAWLALLKQTVEAGTAVDGTSADDVLSASGWGAHRVVGGAGNDTIMTGADGGGMDTLNGGQGQDTYVLGPNWGRDVLIDDQGASTLRFADGLSLTDLRFFGRAGNLVIAQGLLAQSKEGEVSAPNELVLQLAGLSMDEARARYTAFVAEADGGITLTLDDVLQRLRTGTDGADILAGLPGDEGMSGGAGDDVILGHGGRDSLSGGDGGDTLYGGEGDDVFDGGAGRDVFIDAQPFIVQPYGFIPDWRSPYSTDTYLINRGSGLDMIYDAEGGAIPEQDTLDVIRLGEGIRPEDVDLYKVLRFPPVGMPFLSVQGGTMLLQVRGTQDGAVVVGQFQPPPTSWPHVPAEVDVSGWTEYGVDQIIFADGTIWGREEMAAKAIDLSQSGTEPAGTAGNDSLAVTRDGQSANGGLGTDEYNITAAPVRASIYDEGALPGETDVIRLPDGIRPQDVELQWHGIGYTGIVLRFGIDTQIEVFNYTETAGQAGQGHIRIAFADGTQWMPADVARLLPAMPPTPSPTTPAPAELLVGSVANDAMSGAYLHGAQGNDTLQGRPGGENVFIYNKGDGDDLVLNEVYYPSYRNPYPSYSGESVIRFGEGIAPSNLVVDGAPISLGSMTRLGFGDLAGSLDVRGLKRIEFHDGTVWDKARITEAANAPHASARVVMGGLGNDSLSGVDANERIHGGAKERIYGGDGRDTLAGSDGDTLSGGAGNDIYYTSGETVTVRLEAGGGRDRASLAPTHRVMLGDGLQASDVRLVWSSEAGAEGGELKLQLSQGRGELVLGTYFGQPLADVLSGLPGIYLANGQSIGDAAMQALKQQILTPTPTRVSGSLVEGGQGDDTVTGAETAFVYNLGGGHDQIRPASQDGATVLRLGTGILASDVTVHALAPLDGQPRWRIGLQDRVGGVEAVRLSRIEFADGTVWSASQIQAVADRSGPLPPNDTIIDLRHTSSGRAAQGTVGTDSIWGGAGNDTLDGLSGDNDRIQGLAGHDLITADGGFLYGGTGNDTIKANGGQQRAYVNVFQGEGQDAVHLGDHDHVSIESYSDEAIIRPLYTGTQVTGAVISFAGRQDTITLPGLAGLVDATVEIGYGNRLSTEEVLARAAGFGPQRILGTEDQDTILGNGGDDTLIGLGGADSLLGGEGHDKLNAGGDGIWRQAGSDTLRGGIGDDELSGGALLQGGDGNDTLRAIGDAVLDGGTGNDEFVTSYEAGMRRIVFGRGSGHDVLRNGAPGVTAREGGVTIAFGYDIPPEDVIMTRVPNGTGQATLLSLRGSDDSLRIEGFDDWTAYFEFGKLSLKPADFVPGPNADLLIGTDRTDTLRGGLGNDTLRGGAGDDLMEGGQGADTYRFSAGDGHDTLIADGQDQIFFGYGIDQSTVRFSAIGTSLHITSAAYSEFGSLLLQNVGTWDDLTLRFHDGTQMAIAPILTSSWMDQAVYGAEGDDTLRGFVGADHVYGFGGHDRLFGGLKDDVLFGGQGNDTMRGDEGADTYADAGEGVDVIDADALDNILLAEGLRVGAVRAAWAPGASDELVMSFDSGSGQVRLLRASTLAGMTVRDTVGGVRTMADVIATAAVQSGQTLTGASGRDTLQGGDGNDTISGVSGNDLLTGGRGDDWIDGGAGNDTMRGGLGNDTLIGTKGNDTYQFARGDGRDTIVDSDGTWFNSDLLQLSGAATNQLWFTRSGSNLDIAILGTQDKVTVQGWYSSASNRLEKITAMDSGKSLTVAKVNSLVSAMAAFSIDPATTTQLPANTPASLSKLIASSWT